MKPLPSQYAWLAKEPAPRMLVAALAYHGVEEIVGPRHNQMILDWAKKTGAKGYTSDEIAWCGLFMSMVAYDAGYPYQPRGNALWARNWADWGTPVQKGREMLGDVLVFARGSGGHVAIYVGEDKQGFLHILGGNQLNKVCVVRKHRDSLIAVRRSPWAIGQPPNVRKIFLSPTGTISTNEA